MIASRTSPECQIGLCTSRLKHSQLLPISSLVMDPRLDAHETRKRNSGSLDVHLRAIDMNESILLEGDLNGHVGSQNGGYMLCHGGQELSVCDDNEC